MANPTQLPGDLIVAGNLTVAGNMPTTNRTSLAQESLAIYNIPLMLLRKHDDLAALLPATPATDDLGIVTGTPGTDVPTLQTEDLKAEGGNPTLNRCTFEFTMPPEFDDTTDVTIDIHAGMLTTIADDTATVDVEVWESDKEAGAGADLCATAAQSINSLTLATKTFVITAASLISGDKILVRITTSVSDGSTGTVVKAIIGDIRMRLDIRG